MTTYHIHSVNVGKPQQMNHEARTCVSGIKKEAVTETIYLSSVNLAGDGQADLKNHGGKDKAICVYPYDHYAYWENKFSRQIAPAAFGENITITGMTEDIVSIGDTFEWGEAILQVSQPRMPCFKVGMRNNEKDMDKDMINTGFTGYYMRVLKEGNVSQRSPFKWIDGLNQPVAVSEVNDAQYHETSHLEKLSKLLELDELAEGWKQMVNKRLAKLKRS